MGKAEFHPPRKPLHTRADGSRAAGGGRGRTLHGLLEEVSPWSGGFDPLAAAVRARIPLLVATHAAVFAFAYLLAYLIRFDGVVPARFLQTFQASVGYLVAIKLVIFFSMGSYQGWYRGATFADMVQLMESAALATVGLVLAVTFAGMAGLMAPGFSIPRSIFALDWAGTVLVLGSLRGATRLYREYYRPMIATHKDATRVVMLGAEEINLPVIRAIQVRPELNMRVIGFLDADTWLHGRSLGGIKVLGSPSDVRRLAALHRIQVVLVPSVVGSGPDVRALIEECNRAAIKVQIVPGYDAILNGAVTVQPRDVDIHDLLCRKPVQLDTASVARFLKGKVVMVTGAAGSIGSELCRQVLPFRPGRLILLDHSENGLFHVERELRASFPGIEIIPRIASITDPVRIRSTFEEYGPAVVFHAAAHKHVPMMEANPGEAVKNNVLGTRVLVDEAVRAEVETFVMISTDKAVNPTSVMGACKRLAEMYVQALSSTTKTRLVTVRFGNVLGSNGSVVPVFKEQIRKGGPITVTHPEMTRFFMTIPEAANLVLQAGELGRGGEIFVLDMGEPVKIVELARDMIRLSGLTEDEISIAFCGLRPGEKLYEELYDDGEERLPTSHAKIFRAQHRPCAPAAIRAGFDRLARLVDRDREEVVAALQSIVTEYRPNRPGAEQMPCVNAAVAVPETVASA